MMMFFLKEMVWNIMNQVDLDTAKKVRKVET
jgi:hypothetical protein